MTVITGRKWPAIDILRLQARAGSAGWNALLTKCQDSHDVETLKKTLYGIQAGMVDLEKTGMVTEPTRLLFLRLQRSLELTAKRVFREKYPSPLDNPLIAGEHLDLLDAKRKRDQAFEAFLREASF